MHTLVKDIINNEPVCLEKDANLELVNQLITKRGISRIPVIDDGKLIGIVTKADLIDKAIYILKHSSGKSYAQRMLQHVPVDRIMTTNPVFLNQNDTIEYAIETLLENKFHSLVVVDDQMQVKGIVTSYDLLNAYYTQ